MSGSSQLEEPHQVVQPLEPVAQKDTERKHRKLESEEFKAKLEMTKAFCDTAKGYVQISSAGLALPLLFQQAMLGKVRSESGLLGSGPWELIVSWALFLIAIVFGLLYQWLSMRRLWDQYHMGNRTPENMHEPGYRITPGVVKLDRLNLSWIWLGMMSTFYLGAVFFVIYAGTVIAAPSTTGDSRATDAATIQALDEQWSATAARNDLEGTVAFYADDAVLLPPNAPIATDRKSIRESWARLLVPNTVVSWKVYKVEVAKSGELGHLYGAYTLSIHDPKGGPLVRDTGKLVEIWKKQADGKWKCIVDTYNSDLAIPPALERKN